MGGLCGHVNPNIQFANRSILILFYKAMIQLFLFIVYCHFSICEVIILSALLGFDHFFQYINWHVESRKSKQSRVF